MGYRWPVAVMQHVYRINGGNAQLPNIQAGILVRCHHRRDLSVDDDVFKVSMLDGDSIASERYTIRIFSEYQEESQWRHERGWCGVQVASFQLQGTRLLVG